MLKKFQNRSCFKVRTLFCSGRQTGKFPKALQTVMQTVLLGRHSPSHLTSLLVRTLYRTTPGGHMGQAEGILIPHQGPWLVPHLGGVGLPPYSAWRQHSEKEGKRGRNHLPSSLSVDGGQPAYPKPARGDQTHRTQMVVQVTHWARHPKV